MADSAKLGPGTGFFSNLIGCFTLEFYRRAAKYPMTKAFIHVAVLCAVLAAVVVWIAVYPQYKIYEEQELPKLREFFEKSVDEGIYIEDGKVVYEDVKPHENSMTLQDRKIGVIIDPEGKTEEIPDGYFVVLLFSGEKVYSGGPEGKREFRNLPEEKTSARRWIMDNSLADPGTGRLVSAGTQIFTAFFALVAVIAGLFSLAIYGAFGRQVKGLGLAGQLNICVFAATPLIVGLIAATGVAKDWIMFLVLGITGGMFLLLAVLATMHVNRYGVVVPGKTSPEEKKTEGQ